MANHFFADSGIPTRFRQLGIRSSRLLKSGADFGGSFGFRRDLAAERVAEAAAAAVFGSS
jgi:hypothetical protein